MPPGPKPKNPKLRQRRNKKASAAKMAITDEVKGVPPLPARRRKWLPETLAWWKSVWESPMAKEGKYIGVDIHRLYMLADLTDRYWRASAGGYVVTRKNKKGKVVKKVVQENLIALAVEIRLQSQCFGLTPIDRNRLDWQFEKTDDMKNKGQKRRNAPVKNYSVDPRAVIEAKN